MTSAQFIDAITKGKAVVVNEPSSQFTYPTSQEQRDNNRILHTEGNEEKTVGSFIELDHTNNTNDTVTINLNEE